MIVTAKKRIPNLWILVAILPWSAVMFKWLAMGTAFTFSLKKFIDNPAGLTFILSLPQVMALFLGPVYNFMSDRVWTRFGRRKPFVVTSWVGVIFFITIMPLMPNFWWLLAAYLAYSAFNDIGGGPMETLKQEIVPPKQRGLSAAGATWMSNFANLTFMFVAIGRFDDYKFMAGLPVTGEQSIYWSLAAAMTIMLLVIMLGVKESDPKSSLCGQRFSFRNFFGGILKPDLWPVYFLIFGSAMLNAGLGVMGVLLYTEQWQFTKQEMGLNIAVGGVMNMGFIAILAIFANKLPRMKTYQVLNVLFLLVNLLFYLYVHLALYDQRPTLVELIVFGETLSVIGILISMVYTPLVYDYVPRNEMGTYAAGAAILQKIVGFVTLNGVGLFVWAYSSVFLPPGGDMTRVALRQDLPAAEVQSRLASIPHPATGQPVYSSDLSVEAWYATGAALDHGRAFELRLKNPASIDLKKQRDSLEQKINKLTAQEKNARRLSDAAASAGKSATSAEQAAIATARAEELRPLVAELARMDAQLQANADAFRAAVTRTLAADLAPEGSARRSAERVPGFVASFPLPARPPTTEVEKALDRLRLAHPEVVDLRVAKSDSGFRLDLSAELPAGADSAPSAATLADSLGRLGPKLHADISRPPVVRGIEFVALALDIVEDPLDRHVSPITSVVNSILVRFTDVAPPERRVFGLARGLRGDFEHVGVRPLDPTSFAIRVVALPPATPPADVFAALEQRVVEIGPQQRITVVRPVLAATFAKMKYDYMSGYLWMLGLGVIGLAITIAFARREAKGLIHKRGLEESEAIVDTPVSSAADAAPAVREETYTPGYLLPKLGIVVLGLGMIGVASFNLVPSLRLMLVGQRVQAEAVAVYKEKLGGETVRLATDAEILAAHEASDRSYVFWNEYRYRAADGTDVVFRASAGSQLKPAHPLFDDDGLPTVLTAYHDPAAPKTVLLPTEFSTWFMPGTLALFGAIGAILGTLLAWHARRPIPLPHIHPS